MDCIVFCSFLCVEVCVAVSNLFVIFTLVVGDFAYGSETVYVMGGLLFDGMFGLHIQLLRHLVAVVGKKIIV